ncbi:MAG: tRNA 2-thiouridine(34) synthase MnmA [bacterium]
MSNKKRRIITGLSGGVDSSVAALLLLEQGYEVEGLFMKNWEEDDEEGYCAAEEDLADAQSVADNLGIPLHTVNFSSEYWDKVFAYFLEEYRSGRTPNPDIMCNKEIKFKAFLEYATHLGASHIATGHYARIDRMDAPSGSSFRLLKGRDHNKDQSYFLYTLGQAPLSRSVFPLGELEKPEVRQIAEKRGFTNHAKKDSTGICFIGERKFKDFLNRFLPAQPGEIVTPEGDIIGEHAGLMYHTLGQRQGLGIGGMKSAENAPWFVVDKDLKRNRLIVAQGHTHPLMMHNTLRATQLSWVSGNAPRTPYRCHARIRYRQGDQACVITDIKGDQATVVFDEDQRAITPGQSIVFYSGEECLGGAIINERLHSQHAALI